MLCHAQFLLKLYQVYELTVSSEGETELNRKTLMKYSMKLPKKKSSDGFKFKEQQVSLNDIEQHLNTES